MSKLKSMEDLFAGRHFERNVIILCVRWYLRYKLSLRDLVEMMAERGLSLAHTKSHRARSSQRQVQNERHARLQTLPERRDYSGRH
jgi:transposase-like protein